MTTALYGRFDFQECEEGVKINHVWESESGLPTSKLTNGKPAVSSPVSVKRESHWLSQKPFSIDTPTDSGMYKYSKLRLI